MNIIEFLIEKKSTKQQVPLKKINLKLSFHIGQIDVSRIFPENEENVKVVLKVSKNCADLFESLKDKKDSDFIEFFRGGFERKRIILQSNYEEDDKQIYEIAFDKFYNESLINQAYHLLDLSGNQGPQEGSISFSGDMNTFQFLANFPSSSRDSIFNLFERWDPHILKNPFLALLKSIKRGFVNFEIEDWPEEVKEFMDYISFKLSANVNDAKLIEKYLKEPIQLEVLFQIKGKFEINFFYQTSQQDQQL